MTRIKAVAQAEEVGDTEYLLGLRTAVEAAIDFGLTAVAVGEERAGPLPVAMLVQAKQAVHSRVGLETVLRRYFVGYTAMGDFLIREARGQRPPHHPRVLQDVQRDLAALFDRVIVTISGEYKQTAGEAAQQREARLAVRVRRLLAGDLLDTDKLSYDFEGWHVGVIATGPEARRWLRQLASDLDCRLLQVDSSEAALWAWLASRRRLDTQAIVEHSVAHSLGDGVIALGEPTRGLSGWRMTHRQAEAALFVALQRRERITRYADIGLIASVMKDEVLVRFLVESYLIPLEESRDSSETVFRTLRAYFGANRNVSSAAAALGVARQTVTSRLQAIELRLGRTVADCSGELEAALQVRSLTTADCLARLSH